MNLKARLEQRAQGKCELCESTEAINIYEVGPDSATKEEIAILVCTKCHAQLQKKESLDKKHWADCLPRSMWSEVPAVQVASWRMLNRLRYESWAMEALDMMYLDDETLEWAKAEGDHVHEGEVDLHRDSNGNVLQNGDTVVLVKSLDVKGSTLTAKLGTVVKNIRLVENNTEQIEGKIEGQTIVILTKYVRKQGA
jgi:protein PhnA